MADVLSQDEIEQLLNAIAADEGGEIETENMKKCKFYDFVREGRNINKNIRNTVKEKISPAIEKLVNNIAVSTNKKLEKPYVYTDFIKSKELYIGGIMPYDYLRVININDSPVYILCDTKIMNLIILDETEVDWGGHEYTLMQQSLANKFIYEPLYNYLCDTNPDVKITSSDKIYILNDLSYKYEKEELLSVGVEVKKEGCDESCFLTLIAPEKSWFNFICKEYPVQNNNLSMLGHNINEKYNSYVVYGESYFNEDVINSFDTGDRFYIETINNSENPGRLIIENEHVANGNFCFNNEIRDEEFYFYVNNVIPASERKDYFENNKNNLFIVHGCRNINKQEINDDDFLKLDTNISDDFFVVYKNKIIALCTQEDFSKNKFKITEVFEKPVTRKIEYSKLTPKNTKSILRFFADRFDSLEYPFETFSIVEKYCTRHYKFFCSTVNKIDCDKIKKLDSNEFYVKLVKIGNYDLFGLVPKNFVNSLLKKSQEEKATKVTDFVADNFILRKIMYVVSQFIHEDKKEFSIDDSLVELKNKMSKPDIIDKFIIELKINTKDFNSNEALYNFYFVLDNETGLKLIDEYGIIDFSHI